jgi:hypothetical protein
VNAAPPSHIRQVPEPSRDVNRGITGTDRDAILETSRDLNDELLFPPESDLKATLLTLAACQDHQLAKDGLQNGVFTARLKAVWDEGQFPGENYIDFINAIRKPFVDNPNSRQHPNLNTDFAGDDNIFVKQRPFTI